MPKLIIHSPAGTFDAQAKQQVAAELTVFCLQCEALPASPFVKSTVWTYFNDYPVSTVFMGEAQATAHVVSAQIYTIQGGLDAAAKHQMIQGVTEIFGRHTRIGARVPVYLVVHEVPEANWGIFGQHADLSALRASAADAPAL